MQPNIAIAVAAWLTAGRTCNRSHHHYPGTKIGTVTNIDGFFQIEVPQGSKDVEIRYVGYKTVLKKSQGNLGEVRLEAASQMLRDVVVTQSIAKTRETPVAISEVSARVIDMKLGNQEFPEVLKTTQAYGPQKTVADMATQKSTCAVSKPPTSQS